MAGQIKKKNLLLLGEKYIVEKNCVLQHNDKNKYIFRRIVRLHFFIAKKRKKLNAFISRFFIFVYVASTSNIHIVFAFYLSVCIYKKQYNFENLCIVWHVLKPWITSGQKEGKP